MLIELQRGTCPHQDSAFCTRCSANVLSGNKDSYCTINSEDDGHPELVLIIHDGDDIEVYVIPEEIYEMFGPEGMESLLEHIADYRQE